MVSVWERAGLFSLAFEGLERFLAVGCLFWFLDPSVLGCAFEGIFSQGVSRMTRNTGALAT